MKMYRILLVGIIFWSLGLSLLAQPDARGWEERFRMSVPELVESKAAVVINSVCDFTTIYMDNYSEHAEFRLFMESKYGEEWQNLYESWKIYTKHGNDLATEPNSLIKLADDLAANPNLVSYLNEIENFDVWNEVKVLSNYRKYTDFLDARKAFDANDFAKHMDGELEIIIKDNTAQILWSKKYTINTFWEEFNNDMISDPNILTLIQTNPTPTTKITGIHDFDNFMNLVEQGLTDIPLSGLPIPTTGFNGQDLYKFKPRVKYPDWEDVKSTGMADLSKALIKNKPNKSSFWPTGFTKSDMKEYAAAAVYEGKLLNEGMLPSGLNSFDVTSPNASIDNIAISQNLLTSFPYIP